jgi:small RNA 2'-O-methyltransferase
MTSTDDQIDYQPGHDELKVTFFPPLVLQRRIWILDILRAEQTTKVLDIGCGEGQLLSVLSQPSPWLARPPQSVLSVMGIEDVEDHKEKIPNLHTTHLCGLDISDEDLAFAVQGTTPTPIGEAPEEVSYASSLDYRWEPLQVKIWKGGLECINESFIDIECIVSTEVYALQHNIKDIPD